MDNFWNEIEVARNHFYEQKRLYHEALEGDMMQNLDLKLELCEISEKIQNSEDWKATTQEYKELVEKWKSIGRVASNEKNDELWKRFIDAQNVFFDRKKNYFEQIQQEQEANYAAKQALVEKAVALSTSTEWKETTQVFSQLNEEWKAIGRVPRELSDDIWQAFQSAKDTFFNAKRNNFEAHKLTLEDNYAKKSALVKRIETLKHSKAWKETTDELNELMTEWKSIGQIPREYKDDLWEQFIGARNFFFDRKDQDRTQRKQQFQDRLEGRITQTKDFLQKLEEQQADELQKIEEFKQSKEQLDLNNPKDIALKDHLEILIQQIENKLPGRAEKIKNVAQQLEEILDKKENDAADKERVPSNDSSVETLGGIQDGTPDEV